MDIKSDSFTYHYVAIPPALQLGIHSQPTWELSLVVKGRGRRLIGNISQPFTDGDLVLIPPGIEHCWYFDNGYTDHHGNIINVTVLFTTELLRRIAQVLPEMSVLSKTISDVRDALVIDHNTTTEISTGLCEVRLLTAPVRTLRLIEILLTISELLSDASIAGSRTTHDSVMTRRMQIDTFISCNYNRHINIDEIAGHIGMNKSSFCAFFRKHYADTFIHHLNNYRLDQARYLLQTEDCHISEICYRVGFQSISHFNHLYKSRFGAAPNHSKYNRKRI